MQELQGRHRKRLYGWEMAEEGWMNENRGKTDGKIDKETHADDK